MSSIKFDYVIDEQYLNSLHYQSPNHRSAKHTNRGLLDVPIVAIDGEGYSDKDGDHHYDIICAAGEKWTEQKVTDVELKPEEIFEFLLGLTEKHGKALYFIYGGSYDFNMWVKRMGDRQLKSLVLRGRTKYQHYKISWKPKREIIVTDLLSLQSTMINRGKNKGKYRHSYARRIHIYDVIGFFQMSFVKALEDWNTVDKEAIEQIAQMKALRGEFSEVEKKKILGYCLDECKLLVKLGKDFRAACNRADIRPIHWYGAGALAATLMRNYGVKQYIAEPPEVRLYSLHAYFGGRTEISYQGRLPNGGYQYDINSAYPTAMVDLPCLVHGQWRFHNSPANAFHKYKWGMWRVSWETHGELWNPFPWRQEGRIYYPDKASGIYHTVEIIAAEKLYPNRVFTIHEGWTYEPKCDHQPFYFIPEKAAYRLKLKAEKEPAAKPLKLGLNSLYGKTAQTLGDKVPYQNFFWAGYITAATRAKLLDAIRYCSGTIYSVATDGLISSVEIDELSVGKGLGQWDKTRIVEGFLVKPGIYKWSDPLGDWHYGTRGFTSDEAKWEELEGMWDNNDYFRHWEYPATRFIGLIQAWNRGESWREWFGKWHTQQRRMNFHPTIMTREWDIRMDRIPYDKWEDMKPFMRLPYTCRCRAKLGLSGPYDKAKQGGQTEFLQFLIDEDQP